MERSLLPLTALAIAGLLVSACDSPTASDDWTVTPPSLGAATVTKDPAYFEITLLCTGEYLVLSGVWQTTSHVQADGSGGFHVLENWNVHVDGTGNNGSTYRVNWADAWGFNVGAGNLPYTFTYAGAQTLIGKGHAADLLIHYALHTTINNNGEVTTDFDTEDLWCK